jgi:hypothetical protein
MAGVLMYASVVVGFRRAALAIGRDAMTAFVWSLGTLLLACLISAQKARWLPRRIFPWRNDGNGTAIVPQPDRPNGL